MRRIFNEEKQVSTVNIPHSLTQAIERVAERWRENRSPWLIGGSCGLLLQSVPLTAVPRDLDIYIDRDDSRPFHQELADFALDEPEYSETDKYRSTLSHYSISGVTVELVAGFQVIVPGAVYSIEVNDTMVKFAKNIGIQGASVRLMPLAHELLFNLLRDRPDRVQAIATAMRERLEEHLPSVVNIVNTNRFDPIWLSRIADELGIDIGVLHSGKGDGACLK